LNKGKTSSLKWPVLLVFTRFILALFLQLLLAIPYVFAGNPNPIEAAGHWFTVYGSLIDIGCLVLIAALIKRDNLGIIDLINVKAQSIGRTALTSIGYIFMFLPMSMAGMSLSSYLLFDTFIPQQVMGGIPLWGAVYSVTLWPILWAVAEQVTYQGYALPRIADGVKQKWMAVAIVSFGWAFQHAALPLSLDLRYILLRVLSFIPVAVVMTLLFLRTRKLLPFIIAHWVMDLSAAVTGALIPLLQQR